jgi:phosphoserine phosphatase
VTADPAGSGASGLIPLGLRARLALVRHAESTWVAEGRFQGRLDPPLSDRGRRQAGLLADRFGAADRNVHLPLPPTDPVGIWHSPLARARATAEAVAARLPQARLVPTDALIEIGQGDWEGRLHADVSHEDAERLEAWHRSPTVTNAPNGEPLLRAADRVRDGLAAVTGSLVEAAREPERDAEPWAIVLAHDGILRLALLSLVELPFEAFWSFPFALAGISVIELAEGRAVLRAHDLVDHLVPLAADPEALAEAHGDRGGAL